MAKKTGKSKKISSVGKARKLQKATEHTRNARVRYAIPAAAFARVARIIVRHHGSTLNVSKISPQAIDALQRYVEQSVSSQLDKTRIIMGEDKKTLSVKYLSVADRAFEVGGAATMVPLGF